MDLIAILYIGFFVVGLVTLANLVGKAFNQGFVAGLKCLLFPVGTYYYCRDNWEVAGKYAKTIIVCFAVALVTFLLHLITR